MGGVLDVESVPGGGTCFTAELPVVDVTASIGPSGAPSRSRRILVVEDEEMLALAMARQLASRFDVVIAHDGADALRSLASSEFARVFCDVGLPDIAGTTLFERAVERAPALATRFVFVTGDPLDPTLQELVARHGLDVLEKPFDPADLDALVADVERPASGGDDTRDA
jgi:CheY-like chemotaxis protein